MTALFEPNVERRRRLLKLGEYVGTLSDGQRVSWLEVEQAVGFKMDPAGRSLFRLAVNRSRRKYVPLPGLGVEMSSAENGLDIVHKSARRIVSSLDAARETAERISGRHLTDMTQERRNHLLHQQAIMGALSLSASFAKKLPARTG